MYLWSEVYNTCIINMFFLAVLGFQWFVQLFIFFSRMITAHKFIKKHQFDAQVLIYCCFYETNTASKSYMQGQRYTYSTPSICLNVSSQTLLAAISKLLAEFWLDFWPLFLVVLIEFNQIHWVFHTDPTFTTYFPWGWGQDFHSCKDLLKHLTFGYSHSKTSFEVCLRSLSCWNSWLSWSFNLLADDFRLCWRILK